MKEMFKNIYILAIVSVFCVQSTAFSLAARQPSEDVKEDVKRDKEKRKMETYKESFDSETSLILSTDNALMRGLLDYTKN